MSKAGLVSTAFLPIVTYAIENYVKWCRWATWRSLSQYIKKIKRKVGQEYSTTLVMMYDTQRSVFLLIVLWTWSSDCEGVQVSITRSSSLGKMVWTDWSGRIWWVFLHYQTLPMHHNIFTHETVFIEENMIAASSSLPSARVSDRTFPTVEASALNVSSPC